MKAPIAFLVAALSGPGLIAAATDVTRPNLTMGQTYAAINSAGIAATQGSTVTIFDSFTGATNYTITGSTPRTYMGDPLTVATGSGTDVRIDEATVYLASTAAQTFSNGVVVRIQFWDDVDASNASAIFSTPAGGVQTFTVPGLTNLALNTLYAINLTFTTPINLTGLQIGFVINYQGDNGSGPASTETLSSTIRYAAEPGPGTLATGSFTANGPFVGPDWGYYRNVGNQTNFNYPAADRRTLASIDDQLLAVQLRGAVLPVTLTGFDVE